MPTWYKDRQGRLYKRLSEIGVDGMAYMSYPCFRLQDEKMPEHVEGSVLMCVNYLTEIKGE